MNLLLAANVIVLLLSESNHDGTPTIRLEVGGVFLFYQNQAFRDKTAPTFAVKKKYSLDLDVFNHQRKDRATVCAFSSCCDRFGKENQSVFLCNVICDDDDLAPCVICDYVP